MKFKVNGIYRNKNSPEISILCLEVLSGNDKYVKCKCLSKGNSQLSSWQRIGEIKLWHYSETAWECIGEYKRKGNLPIWF